jgi:DNA-binding NarL/FixJ family response regulator
VTVLIVDDHKMFAESLAHVLERTPGITVVGMAETGSEGAEQAAQLRPRVVLVDYQMPDRDGVTVAAEIKRHDPEVMVVMLTGSADDRVLLSAIDVGCSGFITKDRTAREVADAVRSAAAGDALISPDQLARLLPQLSRSVQPANSDLSEREHQVLVRLAQGRTNKAIADELFLSLNTIRNYVQSVLTKLDAHSKLEAVAAAVREGIIEYPTDP